MNKSGKIIFSFLGDCVNKNFIKYSLGEIPRLVLEKEFIKTLEPINRKVNI